jgi:hypothetical protein
VTGKHVAEAEANAPIEIVPLTPPADGKGTVCADVLGKMQPIAIDAGRLAADDVGRYTAALSPHAEKSAAARTAAADTAKGLDRMGRRDACMARPSSTCMFVSVRQ